LPPAENAPGFYGENRCGRKRRVLQPHAMDDAKIAVLLKMAKQ